MCLKITRPILRFVLFGVSRSSDGILDTGHRILDTEIQAREVGNEPPFLALS